MRRQAPRGVRLKHVVLQHEVARVRPVVRQLARVVIAHHIRSAARRSAAGRRVDVPARHPATTPLLGDEPIHAPAVDVRARGRRPVRPAGVDVGRIVKGSDARLARRIRDAHGGNTAPQRDPVGARIGAEVRVKGTVLLHDHDDVADLVDAAANSRRHARGGDRHHRRGVPPRCAGHVSAAAASADRDGSEDRHRDRGRARISTGPRHRSGAS